MKRVLITGSRGQLGSCFSRIAPEFSGLECYFLSSSELDIGQYEPVLQFLREKSIDFCINCAAYTKVELAEKEKEKAFLVNAEAVGSLAKACEKADCTLVHFSTDYVFDGTKRSPYLESDKTGPLNVYGASKLLGEKQLMKCSERYFIFRTSWLYCDIGQNFFNTIRKKIVANENLRITTEQRGTPTNALDLAKFVLHLIESDSRSYGLYHYSNLGEATWYDFAEAIVDSQPQKVLLVEDNSFKTLAKRPLYSVLSKEKVMRTFGITIPHWKESLTSYF